jgi:hypothetical protein
MAMGQNIAANVSASLDESAASGSSVAAAVNASATTATISAITGGEAGARLLAPSEGSPRPAVVFKQQKSELKSSHISERIASQASGSSNSLGKKTGTAVLPQKIAVNPNTMQNSGEQGSTQTAATYTTDFPDSTKATALISPPDPGTASPLDWSPSLGFEFGDMAKKQFLNPTLHIKKPTGFGHGRHSKQEREREREARRGNGTSLRQGLSTVQPSFTDQKLEPDILNQPILKSPLDQPLGRSIDRPFSQQ